MYQGHMSTLMLRILSYKINSCEVFFSGGKEILTPGLSVWSSFTAPKHAPAYPHIQEEILPGNRSLKRVTHEER